MPEQFERLQVLWLDSMCFVTLKSKQATRCYVFVKHDVLGRWRSTCLGTWRVWAPFQPLLASKSAKAGNSAHYSYTMLQLWVSCRIAKKGLPFSHQDGSSGLASKGP